MPSACAAWFKRKMLSFVYTLWAHHTMLKKFSKGESLEFGSFKEIKSEHL